MAYISFQPSAHFNTKLYTGANKTVTGVGFQPDICWIKERDAAASAVFNAVRGATKFFESNSNGAEQTLADSLTAFTSDGFTLGADSNSYVGGSSQATVSWNWKAGGTGSANTDGSDNSTVSVNTTAGISIVKWTPSGSNATVGHGLGAVPECMLSFRLGGGQDRFVYHKDIGNTHYMKLSTTDAKIDDANAWNDTTPTSSVFSVGSQFGGSDSVQYCFTSVKGFSKVGSYTGNANADGAFIYTGFKPAFVLIKQSSAAGEDWNMYDNKRNTFNATDKALFANLSNAEATKTGGIDFLSNGIKMRGTDGAFNTSQTYIYLAFAEEPLVASNGTPATAR